MSFQAVRLKPFVSTTYHVKVAGLRAKLSWTTVVLCDHLYSRIDSSPKAGLIGHHTSPPTSYTGPVLLEARLPYQALVSATPCHI